MNGPHLDDENNVAAFVQEETVSTYRFLLNGIKAALILAGSIALAVAITLTVWKVTR